MTTRVDDPLLAKQLKSLLQSKNTQDRNYDVSYFDEADKSDASNDFAVMSAVTMDNGVKRGWEVRTKNIRGVHREKILGETLLAKLAYEIDASPNGQNSSQEAAGRLRGPSDH